MRSKKIELRVPHYIATAVEEKRKKMGVKSVPQFFLLAAIYLILMDQATDILKGAANAAPDEQDSIFQYLLAHPITKPELLEWIKKGKPMLNGLFRILGS